MKRTLGFVLPPALVLAGLTLCCLILWNQTGRFRRSVEGIAGDVRVSLIGLDGKVGGYVALARRKGDVWYVAAMNDWEEREMSLDLSFLDDGSYDASIFRDAADSGENAEHFVNETAVITKDKAITFTLAPGGGYVIRLEKNNPE